MARKSNKTAHVLSLITKNKTNEEAPEHNEVVTSLIDNNQKTNKSIVAVDLNKEDSISLEIKENLMKFTDESAEAMNGDCENTVDTLQYENKTKKCPGSENADTQKEILSDKAQNDLPEQPLNIENNSVMNSTVEEPSNMETPLNLSNLDSDKSTFSHESATQAEIKDDSHHLSALDAPSSDNTINSTDTPCDDTEPTDHVDYCYVNVLEEITKERAEEFLKKMGVCTCPRCIVDTIALALNNLPPKYIVASKETVFPLLNFYSNYYSVSITAQLTKACITVGNFPHH